MNTIHRSFPLSTIPQRPAAPSSEPAPAIHDLYIPSDPEATPLDIYTPDAWKADGRLACDVPPTPAGQGAAQGERTGTSAGKPAEAPPRHRTTIYVPVRGRTLRIPLPNLPSWPRHPR